MKFRKMSGKNVKEWLRMLTFLLDDDWSKLMEMPRTKIGIIGNKITQKTRSQLPCVSSLKQISLEFGPE